MISIKPSKIGRAAMKRLKLVGGSYMIKTGTGDEKNFANGLRELYELGLIDRKEEREGPFMGFIMVHAIYSLREGIVQRTGH